MDDPRILIAGGGTGGHLYPAIAIGEALQLRNPRINIHYVGSTFGIEADVLPVKSLPHTLIHIRGFQRSISLDAVGKNLILPFRYFRASRRTKILFQEFNPHAVVGTGGYASAIPIKTAINQEIPVLLQEQNSYPGITTRLYADKAQAVCIAFDEAKNYLKGHCILTGNPTRKSILNGHRTDAAKTFNFSPEKDTVFLFGGSQGSAALNKIMNTAINSLQQEGVQVIWQTGYNQFSKFQHHDSDAVRVVPFINLMSDAYALSDLIISRAGALTLSEITVCGKPSILIPFPGAAGDHQMKNAKVLAKANAAQLIDEKDLSSSLLVKTVLKLLHNKEKLEQMADQTKNLAKPDATETIVDQIFQMIDKN